MTSVLACTYLDAIMHMCVGVSVSVQVYIHTGIVDMYVYACGCKHNNMGMCGHRYQKCMYSSIKMIAKNLGMAADFNS